MLGSWLAKAANPIVLSCLVLLCRNLQNKCRRAGSQKVLFNVALSSMILILSLKLGKVLFNALASVVTLSEHKEEWVWKKAAASNLVCIYQHHCDAHRAAVVQQNPFVPRYSGCDGWASKALWTTAFSLVLFSVLFVDRGFLRKSMLQAGWSRTRAVRCSLTRCCPNENPEQRTAGTSAWRLVVLPVVGVGTW